MDWGFTVTIFLTVAFGAAAIVLAIKLARRKKPVWAYETTNIIGLSANAPPQLKLTFNDMPITDVRRTKLVLFNRGNEVIRKDDVTEKVTIQFGKANILQPPVVKPSKEAIRFSAKQIVKNGQHSIEMDFLYLDHNDGALVEVLHTGVATITCVGNIIGTKGIGYIAKFKPSRPRWWFLSLKLIFPVILIGLAIFTAVEVVSSILIGEPLEEGWWMMIFLWVFAPLIFWSDVIPLFEYMRFPGWCAS